MTINIPKHLTNIKLISQMHSMMIEYINSYGSLSTNSMNNYLLEDKSYDYINDLISMIFPDNDKYVNLYISNMFYRCKGTIKVFELIEKYLGLKYKSDPVYNIDSLRIEFEYVNGSDLLSFNPSLTNFLNTLLYFNDLSIIVNIFKLNVSSSLSNKSSNICVYYKKSYFEFK